MTYPLPAHLRTWEAYQDEITLQLGDTQRTIGILKGQLASVTEKRTNAVVLLEMLPDNVRLHEAERVRLKKYLSSTSQNQAIIGNQIARVEKRLAAFELQQKNFNHAELRKEQKLRQARENVGHLSTVASPNEALNSNESVRY
jgi:chromosome segregation ATPase